MIAYLIIYSFVTRYYLNESEKNSQNYIENYFINASEDIINLAMHHEKLWNKI